MSKINDIILDDERLLLVDEYDVNSFILNREQCKIPAKYEYKFLNYRVFKFNSAKEKVYFLLKWVK